MYTKNIHMTSGIFHGRPREKALYIYFITYDIRAAHDGKVGCNTVQEKRTNLSILIGCTSRACLDTLRMNFNVHL